MVRFQGTHCNPVRLEFVAAKMRNQKLISSGNTATRSTVVVLYATWYQLRNSVCMKLPFWHAFHKPTAKVAVNAYSHFKGSGCGLDFAPSMNMFFFFSILLLLKSVGS